jgi:hypothetical protein
MLCELVKVADFNPHDQEVDEIISIRTSDGKYSTKSAYDMQFEGSIESPLLTSVWKAWAPSHCKFFLWLMLQNKIWTAD